MNLRRRHGCPTDGELRLALDSDGSVAEPIQQHLDGCSDCSRRFAEIASAADLTQRMCMALGVGQPEPDLQLAYSRFRNNLAEQPARDISGGTRMGQLFATRSMRSASAVVAILAVVVAVTFTPMRTVADDFLNQFRVQEFAAVTIPMDALSPMQSLATAGMSDADKQQFQDELKQLGAFDTTFDYDQDHLPAAMTLDEAEAQFGNIDEPDDLPDGFDSAPNAYLTEAGSASFDLDTAKAQQIIDALGLPIYSLPDPAQYPTLEFSANIPAAALLEYQNADGQRVIVGQMESPTLDIPDGLDMDALREEILRFPGLPSDLVAQLRAIDDWEHTLIIPIPEGATSENITINGEPGLLIEHDLGSAVLWEKDGILHAVIGQVSSDAVRDVADSTQ
jgi:anti-sigma factor RsiW